ncbi:hypothetical protein BGZ94_002260 [Podila epigama]|nr:hypothetical protein BGZ94_002260 [Podila epigama]
MSSSPTLPSTSTLETTAVDIPVDIPGTHPLGPPVDIPAHTSLSSPSHSPPNSDESQVDEDNSQDLVSSFPVYQEFHVEGQGTADFGGFSEQTQSQSQTQTQTQNQSQSQSPSPSQSPSQTTMQIHTHAHATSTHIEPDSDADADADVDADADADQEYVYHLPEIAPSSQQGLQQGFPAAQASISPSSSLPPSPPFVPSQQTEEIQPPPSTSTYSGEDTPLSMNGYANGHHSPPHDGQHTPLSIDPGLHSPPTLEGLAIVSPSSELPAPNFHSDLAFSPMGQQHTHFFSKPNSDGHVITHRNSIAGTTVPMSSGRSRRTGSLTVLEEGPYFSDTQQFYNIYDMNQTRSFQLEVTARIDKGFFTSNNIWTCYRRNYFQVSTTYRIKDFNHNMEPDVPCLLEVTEPLLDIDALNAQRLQDPTTMTQTLEALNTRDRKPEVEPASVTSGHPTHLEVVTGFSVSINSSISCSDKKIELVLHTPKRDKGPQSIPGLREIRGGGMLIQPASSIPQSVVTFERVQFKTATANNGKRKAAQQFYVLMVDLYAHTESGRTICVASCQSDTLVVRGRSPGHYTDEPSSDCSVRQGVNGHGQGQVQGGGYSVNGGPERRHSTMVPPRSYHPYFHNDSVPPSRSPSISAGAGMSIDMNAVNLGVFGAHGGGPLSPMSPGGVSDYSPTVGPSPGFYQYPGAPNGWPEGSSMSSPASNYDGSTFSSPVSYPPSYQQHYSDPSSPQEQQYPHHHPQHPHHHPQQQQHHHQHPHQHHQQQHHAHSHHSPLPSPHVNPYYHPRQNFAAITPRLMAGPGHPFDNRFDPSLEHGFENGDVAHGMLTRHDVQGLVTPDVSHGGGGGVEAEMGYFSEHNVRSSFIHKQGAHPLAPPLMMPAVDHGHLNGHGHSHAFVTGFE